MDKSPVNSSPNSGSPVIGSHFFSASMVRGSQMMRFRRQLGLSGTVPYIFLIPTWDPKMISSQWEFQDPKMEVLYHIRPYFVVIFPYIGLI